MVAVDLKDREGEARRDEKEIETIRIEEDEDGEDVTEVTPVPVPEVTKKRVRPPTTGEYVGLADEKERANKAKEEALRLEQEERTMKLTNREIIKMNKIDLETVAAAEEHNPTADIVNRLRELQVDILKVARTSGNLKGGYLKKSAGWILGLIEVLRTRLDRSAEENRSEELKALQRDQEKFQKDTERQMAEMQSSLRIAIEMAEVERRKAEHHLNLLMEATKEKEELRRQLQKINEEQNSWWGEKRVPMEITEEPHTEPYMEEPTIVAAEEREEVTSPSPLPKSE